MMLVLVGGCIIRICYNDSKSMKTVVQRVNHADVKIDGQVFNAIGLGLLVLVGIEEADNSIDIEWLANKLAALRIFDDENGVMNKSVIDVDGEVLVISQFTLHASTKKGNRPSYIKAAKPEISIPLYKEFVQVFSQKIGKPVKSGQFGAEMIVGLENNGPVTIIIDTKNKQ